MAKSIANPVTLPPVLHSTGDLVDVLYVGISICVEVACLASMRAILLVGQIVVIAEGARARDVGAIQAVVAHVALAEAEVAIAVTCAVVDAVVQVVVPHV